MSIVNTLLELVCALLPIPAVLSLQMDRKQRWGVIGVLSLGILVVLVGCVRVYFVHKTMMVSWDTSWWGEAHWITSEVENDLSLVCYISPNDCYQVQSLTLHIRFVPVPQLSGQSLDAYSTKVQSSQRKNWKVIRSLPGDQFPSIQRIRCKLT
jgi:hypothetical protein